MCGGGVWTPTGPLVSPEGDSLWVLIPVGNGQLDLQRQDYAQSLLRVGPGLDFAPDCDPGLCANFDPHDPDRACLQSCKNLFIPRLLPNTPPLRPAPIPVTTGLFMACLATIDADGASAIYDGQTGRPVYPAIKEGAGIFLTQSRS